MRAPHVLWAERCRTSVARPPTLTRSSGAKPADLPVEATINWKWGVSSQDGEASD